MKDGSLIGVELEVTSRLERCRNPVNGIERSVGKMITGSCPKLAELARKVRVGCTRISVTDIKRQRVIPTSLFAGLATIILWGAYGLRNETVLLTVRKHETKRIGRLW
jgi:hypothetical protein